MKSEPEESDSDWEYDSDESEDESVKPAAPLLDLEDMGKMVAASKAEASQEIREMVTPTIRKNLEKQGYKIIGSHSGVKLCRWTKVNEIIMKWLILFSIQLYIVTTHF